MFDTQGSGGPGPMPKESGRQLVDGILTPIWTKDPPTEPGLYWFQLRTDEGYPPTGVIRFCRVHLSGDILIVDWTNVERMQRWWAGPLLKPEEG